MKDQFPWCSGHPRGPREGAGGAGRAGTLQGPPLGARSLGSHQETSPWLRKTEQPAELVLSTPRCCQRQHPYLPQLDSPRVQVAANSLHLPQYPVASLNVNPRLRPHCTLVGPLTLSRAHTHTNTHMRTHTGACLRMVPRHFGGH